jgi:hypothetical protein
MVLIQLKDFVNLNNSIDIDFVIYEVAVDNNFSSIITNGKVTKNIEVFEINLNSRTEYVKYDINELYVRIRIGVNRRGKEYYSKWFVKEPDPEKDSLSKYRNIYYKNNIIGRVMIDGDKTKVIW